jgi:hypothetical protein
MEMWLSMNATTTDPATRTSDKEPRKIPNKNRTGRMAEHGQDNHLKRNNNTIFNSF